VLFFMNLFDEIYDESYLEDEPCTIHGESSCPQCMEGDFRYPTFQEGVWDHEETSTNDLP
jgi:hypothetical protein